MFNFIKKIFKHDINTPSSPPPATPPGTSRASGGKNVKQEAFDQKMELINLRINNSNFLMSVVLVALAICFITLFFQYQQFASTSYSDYSHRVNELNSQKYQFQQSQIDFLLKVATASSKIRE